MIPKLENLQIGQEIEIIEQPTNTYRLDINKKEIRGYTDGIEAMKQAIYKMLMTERYKYVIYDWNYGIELADLFGKPRSYVYSELKRRIKESLLDDDRIIEVDNFVFEAPKRDVVAVKFTVNTIFGDIDIRNNFNVGVNE